MRRRAAWWAAFACATGLGTGSATAATTVYVAPSGSGTACTQSAPCSFDQGVGHAPSGATVSVAAGSYTSAGGLAPANGVAINGPTGGTATVTFPTFVSTGAAAPIVLGQVSTGSTNALSNLTLICPNCQAAAVAAEGDDSLDRLTLVAPGSLGLGLIAGAAAPAHTVTVTNSLLVGGQNGAELDPEASGSVITFTNDTLVGAGTGYALSDTDTPTVNFNNSIAYQSQHPGSTSIELRADNLAFAFTSDDSNYPGYKKEEVSGGTVNVTETGVVHSAPSFVSDASDLSTANFEEASGSDTIAAADTSKASGSFDLAGQPRELGGKLDIGAYEYVPPPSITIGSPSARTHAGFTLNGSVTTADATGSAVFDYGASSSYGHSTAPVTLSSTTAAQAVTGSTSGLEPAATYHYALCVTLVVTTCSPDQTVSTLPLLAVISSEHESGSTAAEASVSVVVNPENSLTQVGFQYGTTTGYGTSTAFQSVAASLVGHAVTVTLSKLKPGTLYHVRAVAKNAAGTTHGPDFTFVTNTATGAPTVGGVVFSPRSFTARAGGRLMLTLSQSARVTVKLVVALSGHRVHGRCSTAAKHGRHCRLKRRYKRTLVGVAGANTFKLATRGLPPGRYTATIFATNGAGKSSKPVTARFTIKR